MRKAIGIALVLTMLLGLSSAMAFAAPKQDLSEQGTQMRDRICERLEEQLRTRINEGYPELTKGKLGDPEQARIMEELQTFAAERTRAELGAEQGDDATKEQVRAEIEAQLQKMVRDQVKICVKERTMTQIRSRIAEKKQFRVHLETGEYQFKNKGEVRANGHTVKFDVPPVIKNGRTLVPVRALTESLGATVEYDEETNSVTVAFGDTVIMLIIGDNVIYVNGEEVSIDIQSANVDGRAVLPLRALVENLGGTITYDEETNDVEVTLPPADDTTTE